MKTRGIVLDPRRYRTSVSPPAALEDTSRFGNDGVHANITWVRLPSGLWVRSFNGANSVVSCGNGASLQFVGAKGFSFELWCNITIGSADGILLHKGTWLTGRYKFTWDLSHDRVSFELFFPVASHQYQHTSITAGVWQHYVATYDAVNMRGYVNTIEGTPDANTEGLTGDSTRALLLGRRSDSPGFFYSGLMALPRIYNYALSPADIYAHYQAERRFFGR